MKKKILLGALAICLCVALVSCSDESLDKLGSIMGKMGNNVYGITQDMKDVAAVTSTITNSVATNEAGEIEIDLESASEIIQKLAEIGTSEQKISQTKEDLKKPITVEGKTSTEVQVALQKKLEAVSTELPDTSTIKDEKVKSAVNEVNNALTTIKESIPEEPTQADLATVVIINSLATEVKELSKTEIDTSDTSAMVTLVDKALSALDALKVTTEAADLDVLGDFNLTSLLSTSETSEGESKAVSKDGEDSETTELLKNLKKTFAKIATLISTKENGVYKFNKVKYQRFILQMTALRSTYEVASLGLLPKFGSLTIDNTQYENLQKNENYNAFAEFDSSLSELFALNNSDDLTMNDFTLYVLAFMITEMDKSFEVFDIEEISLAKAFEKFVSSNEENLKSSSVNELDFSAFDFISSLEFKDGTTKEDACDLSNKTIVMARTALVISVEGLASEDFVYSMLDKTMSNASEIKKDGLGKFFSDIVGTFIRSIDPVEE